MQKARDMLYLATKPADSGCFIKDDHGHALHTYSASTESLCCISSEKIFKISVETETLHFPVSHVSS